MTPMPPSPKPRRIDEETEAAVRRFMSRISGRHDPAAVILYGSRARGTHRSDSDADVAVILKDQPRPVLSTALELADAAYDILLETGINISPIPVWLNEWKFPETHSNPTLLRNIAKEGIRL